MASARPHEAIGPNDVGQRLWTIDPDLVPEANDLLALAGSRPLTIADGHHRYETALRYRDSPGAPASADHVLALLYSGHSNGLALAPWHRVIAGVDDSPPVLASARELYDASQVTTPDEILAALHESGDPGVLGVWTRAGGSVLEVDRERAGPFVAGLTSEAVRWLDVSVLSGTLAQMIGASEADLTAAAAAVVYARRARGDQIGRRGQRGRLLPAPADADRRRHCGRRGRRFHASQIDLFLPEGGHRPRLRSVVLRDRHF